MLLGRKTYLIKERVSAFKLVDTYDILDPETGGAIGIVKDEPSSFAKWLRLLVGKRLLATTVTIRESESGAPVVTLHKHPGFFRVSVDVEASGGRHLGRFQSKIWSIGGGFYIFDSQNRQVAEVKGDWKGWNFQISDSSGAELGVVTKKWAGIGKELFTTADNYIVSVSPGVDAEVFSPLILAAGIAIDVVLKERPN